jgi:hypothetical protein
MDTVRLETILCKSTDTFDTAWRGQPDKMPTERALAGDLKSEEVTGQGVDHGDDQASDQPVAGPDALQAIGQRSR